LLVLLPGRSAGKLAASGACIPRRSFTAYWMHSGDATTRRWGPLPRERSRAWGSRTGPREPVNLSGRSTRTGVVGRGSPGRRNRPTTVGSRRVGPVGGSPGRRRARRCRARRAGRVVRSDRRRRRSRDGIRGSVCDEWTWGQCAPGAGVLRVSKGWATCVGASGRRRAPLVVAEGPVTYDVLLSGTSGLAGWCGPPTAGRRSPRPWSS
jgi:hypothetical protein